MTTDRKLPPSRTADQFVLRLPDGMRDRIAALAKDNGRSMNAEIVARLDASLRSEVLALDEIPVGDIIGELMNRFGPDMISIRLGRLREDGSEEPTTDRIVDALRYKK